MFDIGMSELLLIGIVALIVVGPKDLPALFHTLGRFTAKMRSLGREFTNAMNAAARDSGMEDVAKGLKDVANPKKFGLDKQSDRDTYDFAHIGPFLCYLCLCDIECYTSSMTFPPGFVLL